MDRRVSAELDILMIMATLGATSRIPFGMAFVGCARDPRDMNIVDRYHFTDLYQGWQPERALLALQRFVPSLEATMAI